MKTNQCLLVTAILFIASQAQADAGIRINRYGMKAASMTADKNIYRDNGIVRTDPSKKQITLIFTAADKADGADAIIGTLKKQGVKGAFFFTGEFFNRYPEAVRRLKAGGHYIGAHGYGHLLYCSWEDRNKTLVTREEFTNDLKKNYKQLEEVGISYADAPFFVPPYEHYNAEIAAWCKALGLQLINFTEGTLTNADYTTPDMKNYRSSKEIYDRVMSVEAGEGLNGHIMLIHLGTDDQRSDKFYQVCLEKMIKTLKKKGYSFVPLREAVGLGFDCSRE
jgi:peptidoglycan/xylan/chitin deacetylase (PgdA/CDA1 family)